MTHIIISHHLSTIFLSFTFTVMLIMAVPAQSNSDTCTFNGQIFQRGESYGDSFVTRCGSAADFPCYCNPDLSPPMECNYCSFVLQGGGLLCARNDETVRFTDKTGVDQTCSCQVENGLNPSAACTIGFVNDGNNDIDNVDIDNDNVDDNDSDNQDNGSLIIDNGNSTTDNGDSDINNGNQDVIDNGNSTTTDDKDDTDNGNVIDDSGNSTNSTNQDDDTDLGNNNSTDPNNDSLSCLVTLPSGVETIVPNGGYIYQGEKANLCGEDYPCLCNMGQVECPYCTFNAIHEDVVCARDQESVIFQGADFQIRSCTCQLLDVMMNSTTEDGSIISFSSDCIELSTSTPTVAPTTSQPTMEPFVPPPVVDLDCEIKDGKGNMVVVEHGASFGSLVTGGKCGSAQEWPSFCNKRSSSSSSPNLSRNSLPVQDLDLDVEYPYCIFDETYSGDTVCARDNEEVTFLDRNGFLLACFCRAPNGYGQGAMTTCRDASQQQQQQDPTFTWSPTEAPKNVNGGASSSSSSRTAMHLMGVVVVTIISSLSLLPIGGL